MAAIDAAAQHGQPAVRSTARALWPACGWAAWPAGIGKEICVLKCTEFVGSLVAVTGEAGSGEALSKHPCELGILYESLDYRSLPQLTGKDLCRWCLLRCLLCDAKPQTPEVLIQVERCLRHAGAPLLEMVRQVQPKPAFR